MLSLLCRRVGGGKTDPWRACSIIKKREKKKTANVAGARDVAIDHQKYAKGATLYPLEHSVGHGMLCIVPE